MSPSISGAGGGRGGGGGGLHFRDPPDVFADNAARGTAFGTGGTLEGEHTQFVDDRSLAIIIGTIANPTQFQTYTGGAAAYDDGAWLPRTDAVQGRPGRQGLWYARVFQNAATAPTAAPTGGEVTAGGAVTAPTGWFTAEDLTAPTAGQETYESLAPVNPQTDTFPLTPTWSVPIVSGGGVTLAQVNMAVDTARTALEADISANEARIVANEGDITAVDGRVSGNAGDIASNDTELADHETRISNLEGNVPPTPHGSARYAALRPDGAMPDDFTEADFTGAGATSSITQDITTPASNTDMVVGIAVPVSEGPLTAVAELDQNGNINQFAAMIRANFIPSTADTQVTLDISGEAHYVYCTNATVRAIFLGVIGYRLTQTSP